MTVWLTYLEGCNESTTFESQKHGIDSQGNAIYNFIGEPILPTGLLILL